MGPENTNLVYRKTHQDASKIRAEGRKDGKTSKMIKETESTTFTPQTAQHDENVLPSSVSAHSAEDDSTTILSDPESEEYHETVSLKKRKAKQQTIDEAVPKRTLRSSMKKIPTSVTEQDEQAAAEYGTRGEAEEEEHTDVVIPLKRTAQRFLKHKPLSITEKYGKSGRKKNDREDVERN